LNADASVMEVLSPYTHSPLIWRYGLPVPSKALVTASTTAESRSALVASPGLAVWMAPSAAASRPATAGRS
jgi:hypothetical protein